MHCILRFFIQHTLLGGFIKYALEAMDIRTTS